jgi:galactokinase/mevalonate kinase-like predicted kinase
MTIVRARAPLRLGLAGGGTDVSPYGDLHGGYVLNATIDRYAYAVIKTLNEPVVRFIATDQQNVEAKAVSESLVLNGSLDLHKAVYAGASVGSEDGYVHGGPSSFGWTDYPRGWNGSVKKVDGVTASFCSVW